MLAPGVPEAERETEPGGMAPSSQAPAASASARPQPQGGPLGHWASGRLQRTATGHQLAHQPRPATWAHGAARGSTLSLVLSEPAEEAPLCLLTCKIRNTYYPSPEKA